MVGKDGAVGVASALDGKVALGRELVFEIERLKHAPAAPSRFDAAFVLSYRSHADQCRSANDTCGPQVSHEVEIVDPTASSHRGDLAYTAWPAPCEFSNACLR